MTRLGAMAALLACALLGTANAYAGTSTSGLDGTACRTVRLSDVGWTDVTATTAVFSVLLRDLGYQPKVTVLSVPVTFASMKNKDIDVFLGNWMPTQTGDRKAFDADGSVEVIGANLTGAKYTLAVPAYTYAAGRGVSPISSASDRSSGIRSMDSSRATTATV
jgi:glycine betaine/proline transport system substrate-binding protein